MLRELFIIKIQLILIWENNKWISIINIHFYRINIECYANINSNEEKLFIFILHYDFYDNLLVSVTD